MTLVIHDLSKEEAAAFDFKGSRVISDNGRIRNCIGCFGCWVKTPGQCVIHDGYENVGSELSKCSPTYNYKQMRPTAATAPLLKMFWTGLFHMYTRALK